MLSPSRVAFFALALCGGVLAQDAKTDKPVEAAVTDSPVKNKSGVVQRAGKKDDVKVLQPEQVAAEIARLKTKADIKAEIVLKGSAGRAIKFAGVVRNGKLVERIIKRQFVVQKNIEHPRSGVRLWWAGGADGFMFFRWANVKSIALTGRLTAKERREIFERLRRQREGISDKEKAAQADKQLAANLEKMPRVELKKYLLAKYDETWDHKRIRTLKRAQIIEGKTLSRDEAVFVKYFSVLLDARFEELKRQKRKIDIDPNASPSAAKRDADNDGDDK